MLQLANLIYLLFNTVCGFAETKEQLLAFRFLSGLGGSAPQAVSRDPNSTLYGAIADTCMRLAAVFSVTASEQKTVGPR